MKKILLLFFIPLFFFASNFKIPQEKNLLYDVNGDKLFENLNYLLEREKEIPVIVLLKEAVSDILVDHLKAKIGDFSIRYRYQIIPGFAALLKKEQILQLAKEEVVHHIEYDSPVYAFLGTASSWFGVTKARNDFGVEGDRDGNVNSYSSNDIVITILDTGIDIGHYDLDGGKVIGWKDFINNRPTPYDDNGHGTHCASIAAGEGQANAAYRGVAYGAALVGVKVLNSLGSGSTSTIIAGIDWVVQNKNTYNIKILSVSLGISGSSNGQDALSLACNNAVDNGIITVVAAGNSGPARYTIGSPAAAEKVITVGAMADCGEKGFYLANFSSRGPTADGRIKPDVCGPGVNITAARSGTRNSYITYSGTSMATPFIAGVIALMLDANPNLTPTQIKNILSSTCEDWGPTNKDIDYGFGRCQAYEAIKVAGGYSGTGPIVPPHIYASEYLGGSGRTDIWQVNVNSISYPIAITLIIPNWSSGYPDFDLHLYNPAGTRVAYSTGTTRQEYIGYSPTTTGNYRIYVTSYSGSGNYFFDLSCANATSLTLIQDQDMIVKDEKVANVQEFSLKEIIPIFKIQNLQKDKISFTFNLSKEERFNFFLYDGTGRKIKELSNIGKKGKNNLEINLSEIGTGIYFYRFVIQNNIFTGRLIILK
ncbi:MAG: S8 family serine peptidase [candidate division WOR-3 bacterium]|nr:S8 family serine peptidase [candidate division WOR-3 bacterium]MDW8113631.1 S8 family serine peptidase [candidate division WOR-3 bacterium]